MPSLPTAKKSWTDQTLDPNRVLEAVHGESNQACLPSSETFSNAQKDLDWILNSPEILNLEPFFSAQHEHLSIQCFTKPGSRFIHEAQIASEQRRLGLYAEDLLSAYFSSPNSSHILIARNLQVQSKIENAGRTVGEFDFLTQERTSRRYQHIEMACKFYLGLPEPEITDGDNKQSGPARPSNKPIIGSDWRYWVGPNCNDRLDIKMRRFIEHQLLLSQHPEAINRLEELAIAPVDAQYLLRGRLFYPAYHAIEAPKHASSNHVRGLWISHNEAERFAQDLSRHWKHWWFTQLDKLEYLAPRPGHCYHQPVLSADNFLTYLHEYFNSKKHDYKGKTNALARPLPLVISPNENGDDLKNPLELRLFVVPDHWVGVASKQIEAPSSL